MENLFYAVSNTKPSVIWIGITHCPAPKLDMCHSNDSIVTVIIFRFLFLAPLRFDVVCCFSRERTRKFSEVMLKSFSIVVVQWKQLYLPCMCSNELVQLIRYVECTFYFLIDRKQHPNFKRVERDLIDSI